MIHRPWRSHYDATLDGAEARARPDGRAGPGWRIGCGFSNNVDIVVRLDGVVLAELARREGVGHDAGPVDRIETPADCLAGLIAFVRRGEGGDLPVTNRTVHRWIVDHFLGTLQLGGTGAQATNTLARLRFDSLLHVTGLSATQARLLEGSGRLVVSTADGLRPPTAAIRPDDPTMYHVIFEYRNGLTIPLGDETVAAPQANRVIVSFDPVNATLPLDPIWVRAVADPASGVDRVLVSGYSQIVDSACCARRIAETVAAIAVWRATRPELIVHLELGAAPNPGALAAIVEGLAAHVDSIGLNADELAAVLRLWNGSTTVGVEGAVSGLTELRRRFNRPRLGLHTQDFCLSLTRNDPIAERAALLYGAAVGGARARLTTFPSPADLRATLRVAEPAPTGLAAERVLMATLGMNDGIARLADGWMVFVPTLGTPHPGGTVGLGDSFTAGVLAML